MPTIPIEVVITQKGGLVVRREIGDVGRAGTEAASGVGMLTSALATLGAVMSVGKVIEMADAYTQLNNQLKLVSTSTENLVAVQNAVFDIAQRTRSGLAETGVLYAKLARSTQELGLSQQEVADVTETVAKALKVSGASANEAASGMLQLGQALASGKLGGDELRSILENAPRLARAIADGFEVTSGKIGITIADLRKLGGEGELSTAKVVAALQRSAPKIAAEYAQTKGTIKEAFVQFSNSAMRYIGSVDTASGVSTALSGVITGMATNFETVAGIVGVLGIAMAFTFGPTVFGMAIAAVNSLTVALLANPIGLVIGVIAGAAAAIYFFGDRVKVSADGVVTLLDYVKAAFFYVQQYAPVVGKALSDAFNIYSTAFKTVWGGIIGFFSSIFGGISTNAGELAGSIVGFYVGAYSAIYTAFATLPTALQSIFIQAMNATLDVVQKWITGITEAINSVTGLVSLPKLVAPDLTQFKVELKSTVGEYAQGVSDSFAKGMATGKGVVNDVVGGLGSAVDALGAKAREIGTERERLAAAAAKNAPQLSTVRGKNTTKKDDEDEADGKDKLAKALSRLLSTLDPLIGAQEKLKTGTETLDAAEKAGLITTERKNVLLERLKTHLEEALDPLGKMNKELDRELSLIGLSTTERDIQTQIMDKELKLRKAGLDLSPAEKTALEDKIRGLAQLKDQMETVRSFTDRMFKSLEDGLVSFITTGKVDFKSLINSLLADLVRLALQKTVLKPLQDALDNLISTMLKAASGGGAGGFFSSLFGGGSSFGADDYAAKAASAAPNMFGPGFATGGDMQVGGSGGVDSQLVSFRASPGETVSVKRPGDGASGSGSDGVSVSVTNHNDFRGVDASSMARIEERIKASEQRTVRAAVDAVAARRARDPGYLKRGS